LTHGSIIRVDVHVNYHGDVLVQFNGVLVCNDQNDIFVAEPINIYTLEVYTLKVMFICSHVVVTS
jgi:hypothetical protein